MYMQFPTKGDNCGQFEEELAEKGYCRSLVGWPVKTVACVMAGVISE